MYVAEPGGTVVIIFGLAALEEVCNPWLPADTCISHEKIFQSTMLHRQVSSFVYFWGFRQGIVYGLVLSDMSQ